MSTLLGTALAGAAALKATQAAAKASGVQFSELGGLATQSTISSNFNLNVDMSGVASLVRLSSKELPHELDTPLQKPSGLPEMTDEGTAKRLLAADLMLRDPRVQSDLKSPFFQAMRNSHDAKAAVIGIYDALGTEPGTNAIFNEHLRSVSTIPNAKLSFGHNGISIGGLSFTTKHEKDQIPINPLQRAIDSSHAAFPDFEKWLDRVNTKNIGQLSSPFVLGINGKELPYTKLTLGTSEIMIPLTKGSYDEHTAEVITGSKVSGQIAFGDDTGGTLYSPPKWIVNENGKTTGLDYLFGGENPALLSIIDEVGTDPEKVRQALYGRGSEVEAPGRQLLNFVDQSQHVELSLARQGAMVQIIDKSASGIGVLEKFEEQKRLARAAELEFHNVLSPSQTGNGLGLFSVLNEKGEINTDQTPAYTRLALGIGETDVALADRPSRPFIEPMRVSRATKRNAEAALKIGYAGTHFDATGIPKMMQRQDITPFISGTYFAKELSNDLADGATVPLNLGPNDSYQFYSRSTHYSVDSLANTPVGQVQISNSHLNEIEALIQAESEKGSLPSPLRRREIIQEYVKKKKVQWADDTILGTNTTLGRTTTVHLRPEGLGSIELLDYIPGQGKKNSRFTFSRVGTLSPGVKIEGSTKSTLVANPISGIDSLEKRANKINLLRSNGLDIEALGLHIEALGLQPSSIDLLAHSKMTQKSGNYKELRQQQTSAMRLLHGGKFSASQVHVKEDGLISYLQKIGIGGTFKDRRSLARTLLGSEMEKHDISRLQAVFGLDTELQKALDKYGTDDIAKILPHIGPQLPEAIKTARGAIGISTHFVRDHGSRESSSLQSMERRYIEHAVRNVAQGGAGAHESLEILESISHTVNPFSEQYTSTLRKITDAQKAPPSLLDVVTPAEVAADINAPRGKHLRLGEKLFYIPTEDELLKVSFQRASSGLASSSSQIHDTVNKLLNAVKANPTAEDSNLAIADRYLRQVSSQATEVAMHRYTGPIRGSSYSKMTSSAGRTTNKIEAMTVGVSEKEIRKHLRLYRNMGMSPEQAKELEDTVFKRGGHLPGMVWQAPSLTQESTSIVRLKYNPSTNNQGTVLINRAAAKVDGVDQDFFPTMADKISSDFDGDNASTAPLILKDEYGNLDWKRMEAAISDDRLSMEFDRKLKTYKETKRYSAQIGASIEKLMGDKVTQTLPGTAAIRAAGSADIGIISQYSKRISLLAQNLHQLNPNAERTENLMHFARAFEQTILGFKNNARLPTRIIQDRLTAIFENHQTNEAWTLLKGFLKDFGVDSHISTNLDSINEDTGRDLLAVAMNTENNFKLTAKIEEISPTSIVQATGETPFINPNTILLAGNSSETQMAMDAAINASAANPAERATMAEKVGKDLSGISKDIKDAAAAKTAGGSIKVKVADAVQRTLEHTEKANKGILQNKFARVLMIGGTAAAAAYAIFNKGYDDTPLTDIPENPSGRAVMGLSNAHMSLVNSGKLLSDRYLGPNRDTAMSVDNIDYSTQIPSPNTIPNKSYLMDATARISNRNVMLDRTNPVEYIKAIRRALPGSSANLNISLNHRVPSNLEDQL